MERDPLPVGSRIGPYLIERKLGSGGMGTVYYAHHAESGRAAAVKVLPASLSREEGLVARFDREIEALQQLSNPHVVELYESGIDGGTCYYAMEYVDGETIADRLKREKRIDWRTAIDLAVQICSALKSAHDAGIIHRDLKPSNLLVTRDGQIKLADFGIAQVFAGRKLTVTGGVVGTVEYMSPEQAQGRKATKKSDLYSLGAVLYVMLTGRPPFTGKTSVEVLQKHRFNQFDRPRLIVPEIPVWLEEVVCQLLEKDPDNRFPDAYVLSLRLKEIPKKVELSRDERTRTADAAYDGDATTVAASERFPAGPGDGTLMRDLLRAEIERQQRPSPIGRLFDNTWFLLAALALLIAGGFYWLRPKDLSPAEKFAAGEELMQQPPGDGWITARRKYFQPLLAEDPDTWQDRVAPYLERIERYELERRTASGGLAQNRDPPRNDAERFLRLAEHYRDIGDVARAEKLLTSLEALLAGDEEYRTLYEQTQKRLAELKTEPDESNDRYSLLKSAMRRAEELHSQGQADEARVIWQGVIELYGDDPGAAAEVQKAMIGQSRLPEPEPAAEAR